MGEESDAPFINYDTTIQLTDNFSWTVGKHSFKFGGEVRRVRYNQIGGVVTRGRFTFDGRYTQNPLAAAAVRGGSAVADFLLGDFNNSEGQVGAPIANFRSTYFALYLQDNWKVTPKLTMNYGLRWEYDQPFVFDIVRNAPFTIRRNEPAETFRPNLSFDQPFQRTGAPTFILINQFNERSSYVAQWSLGVQRELSSDTSLEVNYFGSAGVRLRRLMSYNNPEPSNLPNSNDARPFPKFGSFQTMAAPSHSLRLGEFEITVLSDGHLTIPTRFLARDVTETEIKASLGHAADLVTPQEIFVIIRAAFRL